MAFTASVLKYDPYRSFKFLVKWDATYVAGISRVSGLEQRIAPVEWRTGGDANSAAVVPGLMSYPPLVLERALSADTAFREWMEKVRTFQAAGGTAGESFHDFRKDILIEVFNLANELVLQVACSKAWPTALLLGTLDAQANELTSEILELHHEGWEIVQQPESAEER